MPILQSWGIPRHHTPVSTALSPANSGLVLSRGTQLVCDSWIRRLRTVAPSSHSGVISTLTRREKASSPRQSHVSGWLEAFCSWSGALAAFEEKKKRIMTIKGSLDCNLVQRIMAPTQRHCYRRQQEVHAHAVTRRSVCLSQGQARHVMDLGCHQGCIGHGAPSAASPPPMPAGP